MVTARNSGTSFSETELNDMGADAYASVRADHVFDMVLCTVKIKQAIAGFSGNSTRYIDAKDRKLVKEVLVYSGSVGDHRILHHRDVRNTAGTTTVYGLREDMHKVAYLDKPMFEELAKTGDSDKGKFGPITKQLVKETLAISVKPKCFLTQGNTEGTLQICKDTVETTRKLPN